MPFGLSTTDFLLLLAIVAGTSYYFFGDVLRGAKNKAKDTSAAIANGAAGGGLGGADGRNFVSKMQKANKKICIFYGSQTGTAEDYATRLAKEAKARFGVSSLVCDPEDYDFDNLDQILKDHVVFFVVATYGEGEPTDNTVPLWDFLKEDEIQFSNGSSLENLNYVVFALGNRTYEHFCAMGHKIDEKLSALGATRIGDLGEGDDDKSMEEDYLAWKDGMWEALQKELGFEEGGGGDVADFEVTEVGPAHSDKVVDQAKIYLGELSSRALTGTKGVYDAKNPYPANLVEIRELFLGGDRNCIFADFDIKDTGIRYQAGDHVGVWPLNPDVHVERVLKVFGLDKKRDTVIDVKSLDPALAKVPFPVPTTYESIFRHYLDICSVAGRQTLGQFSKFAPDEKSKALLEKLGSDKAFYHDEVGEKCLTLAEALQMAVGDDYTKNPFEVEIPKWEIPFDRIISSLARLQPRYYSISSSPKLHPNNIHVTAVVLKYSPGKSRYVFGVGTNYLFSLKLASNDEFERIDEEFKKNVNEAPKYSLEGPRGKFKGDQGKGFKVPVHVRRSNFRLPTSPKIPVVMIGPGTGVAPFRGFIQERIALARKAIERDGPDALNDWGTISLFYGCRKEADDFLYKEEWEEAKKELGDKFRLFTAFSRQPGKPKVYVQNLIKEEKELIKGSLVEKKGHLYICGDARNMAREVEDLLKGMIGEAKGGAMAEGEAEWKLMKDRNRILLDVWS